MTTAGIGGERQREPPTAGGGRARQGSRDGDVIMGRGVGFSGFANKADGVAEQHEQWTLGPV